MKCGVYELSKNDIIQPNNIILKTKNLSKFVIISGNNLSILPFYKSLGKSPLLKDVIYGGGIVLFNNIPIKNFYFNVWEEKYEIIENKNFKLPDDFVSGNGIIISFYNDNPKDKLTQIDVTHCINRIQTITKNGLSIFFPDIWVRLDVNVPNYTNNLDNW